MPTDVYLYLPPPTTSGQHREAHAYGPATGTFHTDLGIEIDPALITANHALAVVNGLALVIPDASPAATATLVLQPSPAAASALTSVVGNSVVVFVYRNVDVPSLRIRFQPRIEAMGDEPFASSEPLPDRVDHFVTGEYGVFVHGGDALGALSTTGGSGGWGQLRFEIAYLPGGLSGPDGWSRLQELVAPANERTRRLDPMAFYRGVATGTTLRLAPAHAGHLLLTLPTRRVLLEVRDEYDAPLVGSVDVLSSATGATTSVALPAGARGTAVLATAPPSGAPPSATYTVATTNQIFTDLPSGDNPAAAPIKELTAAAHWAVQRIFMADVNDPANWFVANATGMPRFTSGNRVTPISDGIPTFAEMVAAMSTVTGAGHYIRLAGWWCTDSFQMIPGGTGTSFHEQTTRMATAGAEVRAMLWDQWGSQNSDEVAHINALPGGKGRAILDNETPNYGSHHQKLLVVNGSGGALAFSGGVDINTDRLDDHSHRAASPFHDVHSKVEGPAVADINRTFVQRWNGHPSSPPVLPSTTPPFAAAPSTHYVQVSRTFAPSHGYPFVGGGEDIGTLNAIRRAIQRAQRFIYIEDQYLTPYPGPFPYSAAADTLGILSDLMAALGRSTFEYLVMVIPNTTDQPQNRYRRRNFVRPLRDAFPTKVFPFYLASAGGGGGTPAVSGTAAADQNLEPGGGTSGGSSSSGGPARPAEIYVHTKAWMVDDVYIKIGSANCNRRSMTHDTEIDVHVIDGALSGGARRMARQFRLDLWGEHLNLSGGGRSVALEDPTHALAFWQHPPAGAHVRPYDENADLEAIHTDTTWNNLIDPDGR